MKIKGENMSVKPNSLKSLPQGGFNPMTSETSARWVLGFSSTHSNLELMSSGTMMQAENSSNFLRVLFTVNIAVYLFFF